MINFDESFSRLMMFEGGLTNDAGGETKYGISKRAFPDVDVANLTENQAKTLYFKYYWDPLSKGIISEAITYQMFDFAVNSGLFTAIKVLQKILVTREDGIIGYDTKLKLQKVTELNIIIQLLSDRLILMSSLPNWPAENKGWTRRIAQNMIYALIDTTQ